MLVNLHRVLAERHRRQSDWNVQKDDHQSQRHDGYEAGKYPIEDNKIKEDVTFRREWIKKCSFGFYSSSVAPNRVEEQGKRPGEKGRLSSFEDERKMVGERGFEPPTPWSRTRFQDLWKSVEIE